MAISLSDETVPKIMKLCCRCVTDVMREGVRVEVGHRDSLAILSNNLCFIVRHSRCLHHSPDQQSLWNFQVIIYLFSYIWKIFFSFCVFPFSYYISKIAIMKLQSAYCCCNFALSQKASATNISHNLLQIFRIIPIPSHENSFTFCT